MTWYRVCLACAVGVALVACEKVEQGVLQPIPPLAGLRYVNLVNDTGAMDFRIVNFVGDAPNAGAATFRTGGAPYGVSTNFLPPHFPVEAGRDVQIRVFMNGLDQSVSSLKMFEDTLNLSAGVNYTFYLYGNARTGGVGIQSLLTVDTLITAPTGLAIRVVHLGGTGVGSQDVDIVARTATVPLTGTASFAGVTPGTVTPYVAFATSSAYKGTLSAPLSRSPSVAVFAPRGDTGTATLNPVAGTWVRGTALSAVIVPASVTGSKAPSTGNPTARSTVSVRRSTDTVLIETGSTTTIKNKVWRVGIDTGRTLDTTYQVRAGNAGVDTIIRFRRRADSTLTAVGNTHGFAAGDMAVIAGAVETQYNGWHYVIQVADTTTCLPADTILDTRRSCSALAADTARTLRSDTIPILSRFYSSTVRSRFRIRLAAASTPTTPATGTVTYRAYAATNQPNPSSSNYTLPWLLFMIDKKPVLTAP